MYVCSCNQLTDTQVVQAARDGASCADDVYAACGCRKQCGRCAPTMVRFLDALRQGVQGFSYDRQPATV